MIKKVKKLKIRRKKATQPKSVPRITNETVAEHREQILAGGRKFKYPVQYARHRLVFNTIGISLLALFIFLGFSWFQLYTTQNTNTFFYRLTQIVPLPVASVDGENALYRNYLMEYRSSIYWLQQKQRDFVLTTPDGQRQSDHIKRQALDSAEETAYATKLSREYDLSVSDKEIDAFINQSLKANGRQLSQKAYESVLSDSYGVSVAEYRTIMASELLQRKVAFEVDYDAKDRVAKAERELKAGKAFEAVAVKYSDDQLVKTTKGDMGFVPKNNRDQGLVEQALKLKKNQISKPIKGTGAYYIIKLIDVNNTQVRYARIKIDLKKFEKDFAQLKKEGKVKEYITVSKTVR